MILLDTEAFLETTFTMKDLVLILGGIVSFVVSITMVRAKVKELEKDLKKKDQELKELAQRFTVKNDRAQSRINQLVDKHNEFELNLSKDLGMINTNLEKLRNDIFAQLLKIKGQ